MVKNLTVGNPALLIVSFAIPLFIGNIFQQIYSITDAMVVGRTIGLGALAAIGCTGSMFFLVLGFVMGFCQGATVITSQRFGAGDEQGVRKSFAAIIIISGFLAVILTTISVLAARPLLEILRTPDDIIDDSQLYITIIFSGISITLLYNALCSVMRAVGDSRTALVFLVIACVLNVILDIAFILVFGMGVEGVAIATITAQLISALLCIRFIHTKMPVLRIHSSDWKITGKDIAMHLKLGLPVGFQMSIIAIGTITVTFVLNQMGTVTLAAFTAASRIDLASTTILHSLGMAMTTYTAQNYGAGKPDRIRKGISQSLVMAFVYSAALAAVFRITGSFFPSMFLGGNSPEALSMARTYLIINSTAYMLLGTLFITRSSLHGLGDSITPTIAGIMELSMRIFAALFLGNLYGFTGVCLANPLAWVGALIPLIIAIILHIRKLEKDVFAGELKEIATD